MYKQIVNVKIMVLSRFGPNVKIVHFIGQAKPWLVFYDTSTGVVRPPGGQEHMQVLMHKLYFCMNKT